MIKSYTTSDPDIKQLLEISSELFDIKGATELLHWDQETYMPPKGVIHRSKQLGTMSAIFHAKLTDKKNGKLLNLLSEKLQKNADKYNDTDRALVRELKRAYEKAIKIPERLVKEMAQAQSDGLEAWKAARSQNKFEIFQKPLQRILDLKIEEVNLQGFKKNPYDGLLDQYEPDLTSEGVIKVFNPLKLEIVSLLKNIQKTKMVDLKSILRGQKYSKEEMSKITEKMLAKIGYDFLSGRQDLSAHPFTINFGHQDVRVTNRYIETDLASSIFSAIHEGGHGLYEMGVSDTIGNTLLAGGVSLGIHESQSRMWENIIGRSLHFWKYWTPYLQAEMPMKLRDTSPEEIFREINHVKPGFIRVDADEVTYSLHIIIRFEIEKDLIEKKIKVSDLPEIWNSKYQESLGIFPPTDTLGVLQDIHWSQGSIGYFPTYTLGNLYSAQIWNKLVADVPDVYKHIESGNFEPILHWLRINIHQYGSIYSPQVLAKKVTGEELNPKYFVDYLKDKFGKLYRL